MKRGIFFILAILTIVFCPAKSEAQGNRLGVTGVYGFPDTVYTLTPCAPIYITVTNTGSVTYQGSVNIACDVVGNSMPPEYLHFDSLYYILVPGDTLQFRIDNYQASTPFYQIGHDVVIVWPIGNFSQSDSILVPTFLIDNTGIGDSKEKDVVRIFPNPVTDRIFIDSDEPGYEIENIRIYDHQGNIISSSNRMNGHSIPTTSLESGFYCIELQFKNGQTRSKKFMRIKN